MKFTILALTLALAVSTSTETLASHTPLGHGLRASPAHHRRLARPRVRAHEDVAALHNITERSQGKEHHDGHKKHHSGHNKYHKGNQEHHDDNKHAAPSHSNVLIKSDSGSSDWNLITKAQGSKFFDQFTFWQGGDPTGGSNHFVSREEAERKNLIGVNKDGNAIITIEKGANIGSRASVHLSSKDTFTGGLFIVKAKHIPVGCGLWPAAWLLSSNPQPAWPSGGEIDMIEGVNEYEENMLSLHTTPGCWAPPHTDHNILGKFAMTDLAQARNCDAASTDDQGCGIRSATKGNYGAPYNKNGGGVHAFLWTEDEAKMFFWTAEDIPSDVSSGEPNPSSWGTPEASWGGESCKTMDYVWNLQMIVSMALCGTWAGSDSTWRGENIGGQAESCQKKTGHWDCNSYLAGNPDLSQAYWEIENISIYQQGGRKK